MPKGLPDLIGKISLNQGLFAYYRGQMPLIMVLSTSQTFRFFVYDEVLKSLGGNDAQKQLVA